MPNRPSWASSFTSSRGRTACSNQSPMSGRTRSRTNFRTVSRMARSSSSSSASMARKSRGSSAVGFAVVATPKSYCQGARCDTAAHEFAVRRVPVVIAAGLALAVGSAIAIGGGYALQHSSASQLPPLTLRRPVHSLALLFLSGRWAIGFFAGIGGWVLYVAALRLAPLSLVQAASAGGIGVLALGGDRLQRAERVGVGAALAGLVLLALSVGAHPPTAHGGVVAVSIWVAASAAAAGALAAWRSSAAALGTAAGVLYAAGDVATK